MSEETLFQEALVKPFAERAAFLDAACAGRPELRVAVEKLLAAHEVSAPLRHQPPDEPALPAQEATQEYSPQPEEASSCQLMSSDHPAHREPVVVIAGRYSLVEKLGEGGMGEVWVAQQTEPVRRKVALKLIKAGMDSKAVLARFEQERQALALMDHPHIARVLDGGLAPDGRPFFVMERVNGLPLTRFCDEARLTPRQRLDLFVPICQAVQHAHQKGIVHRDLKPANILVTLVDGKPVAKVIDFGVAKATAGKLTENSLSTQFGAVIGTLEYMAPEQAGYAGEDIDTRADIYSLGVILYELLTGLRPLDAKRRKQAGLSDMVRILREEEPAKPSTRLSTEASLPSLAALRQTEPKKLMALLRGELDWVVMKCLEKQRDRRYETANDLARDLQRYLADEPVEARPPSARYRLGKFLRRNRGPVLAASLVLLALAAGIVGTTLGMLHAQRAQTREAEQRVKAERARDRMWQALDDMTSSLAGDSLSTQKMISDEQKRFLTEVLSYYRELAADKADDEQARVRTAAAAYRVGTLEYRLGRTEEAVAAICQARDGYEKLAADFPAVREYRQYQARIHNALGILLDNRGRKSEAEQHYRKAVDLLEKLTADFPAVLKYRSDLAHCHNYLGAFLSGVGRQAEAAQHYRKALALDAKLVADFPAVPQYQIDLGGTSCNLGNLVRESNRPSASLVWYEKAIRTLTAVYQQHPYLVVAKQFLRNSYWGRARAYDRLRQYDEAVKDWDKTIELSLEAEQPALRARRATTRLQAGQVAEAVAEIAELAKASNWNAGQWYDFACVYAVARGKVADRKQEYAERAVQLLHQAVKAGYTNTAHINKDTDLDSLRGREDFKMLIRELQKKSTPG